MQQLLSDRKGEAARRTVEDQLRELGEQMGFDFMLVSAADGSPLAGVVRQPKTESRGQLVHLDTDLGADISFVRAWAGIFPTREALEERVGPPFQSYLENSFRAVPGGWKLAFDPEDMIRCQNAMHGNYWNDWLTTKCPALVIRGRDSRVTTREELTEMAHRRPNSVFMELDGGHVVHQDSPAAFAAELHSFVGSLQPGTSDSR